VSLLLFEGLSKVILTVKNGLWLIFSLVVVLLEFLLLFERREHTIIFDGVLLAGGDPILLSLVVLESLLLDLDYGV